MLRIKPDLFLSSIPVESSNVINNLCRIQDQIVGTCGAEWARHKIPKHHLHITLATLSSHGHTMEKLVDNVKQVIKDFQDEGGHFGFGIQFCGIQHFDTHVGDILYAAVARGTEHLRLLRNLTNDHL